MSKPSPFQPPPGFPIAIPMPLDITPQTIAHTLLMFRVACESGNTARANELLIDAQVCLAEFAVHHFQAVLDTTVRAAVPPRPLAVTLAAPVRFPSNHKD